MKTLPIFTAVLLGACALLPAQDAQAAGCGGYVNVFVSGCAPWDNNPRRMPGAPGYVAPQPSRPTVVAQPRSMVVQPPVRNSLISNNRSGLISDNGAVLRNSRTGLVGNDGASLIGNDGSTMRRR
jgi:hypothetical protein